MLIFQVHLEQILDFLWTVFSCTFLEDRFNEELATVYSHESPLVGACTIGEIAKPLRRIDLLNMVAKHTAKDSFKTNTFSVLQRDQPAFDGQRSTIAVPIDIAAALLEFLGDSGLLKEVLDEFLRIGEKQITLLRDALEIEDTATICREAHSIKGGAANLLVGKLAEQASELELAGRRGDLRTASTILVKLAAEFAALKSYLSKADIPAT